MKQISAADFPAEVLQSPIPVIVDFFTKECAPCRTLKATLEHLEREQAGQFKVVTLDASADAELAAWHRVNSVPAIFLYRGGQCVGQRSGLPSKRDLLQWVAT
jgi:thioredoxin-like negative regulator of GroEL